MTDTTEGAWGVLGIQRYVPRLRLDRTTILGQHRWMAPSLKAFAHGHRAIASWDEDSITMAVEAARPLMRALPDCTWQGLTLASTTLPFAERLQAGIAASALGLPRSLMARDVASSLRAASTELLALLRQGGGGAHLLLATDRRIARPASAQEMQFGDGAAAAALGWGHPIAELVGAHSVRADFVHRFRPSGQDHDYGWEERWVRDEGFMKIVVPAIQECLRVAGVQPAEIAQFAMPALLPRIGEAVARKLNLPAAAVVEDPAVRCGDAGTAQPLALLDVALRRATADELVLLVVFGSGCDVLLLRRTGVPCPGMPPDDGKPETNYLKYLSFTGQIELDWGMRAEMDNKTALTAAWRDEAHNAHFEAGECTRCGTVQFPPSRMCVNPACRAQDTQRPHSLADTGARVLSHTSDWLGYTPAPPFQFGHIDFDGGGRVLIEFADTDPDELRVGLPLRMVFRVKEFDPRRGYRRYFWKATPLRAAEQRGAAGG